MHWLGVHRLLILVFICVFWTGLVLAARFMPNFPFISAVWRSEQGYEDLLRREGRKTATREDFVFVGIDQSTLEIGSVGLTPEELASSRALQLMVERPFPWSREVWALLLDRVFAAGARLVMFDVLFNNPNDGDPAFKAALDRYQDKVVVGANFDLAASRDQGVVAQNVPPNPDLIPPPQMQDSRVGYVVFFPDPLDRRIRSVRYTLTDLQLAGEDPLASETPHESLSARAMEKLGRGADVPRDLESHLFRFSSFEAYVPRPLYEIFDDKLWRANFGSGAFFKDKIIIIGASSQVAHDVFDTPLNPETPGPALHLHALAAALDKEFLHDTPLWVDLTGIFLAGVVAWLLLAWIRRPILCILALVGLSVAYLGTARVLYDYNGTLLIAVPTLAAFLLSGLFGLAFEYILERLEKLRTRRTLERYVS